MSSSSTTATLPEEMDLSTLARMKLWSWDVEPTEGVGPAAAQAQREKKGSSQQAPAVVRVGTVQNGGLDVAEHYGDLVLVQSTFKDNRPWAEIADLDKLVGQSVWIRARLHIVRGKSKIAFLVLRRGFSSVQAIIEEGVSGVSRDAVKFASKIPAESIVDIFGEVVASKEEVKATSQSHVEVRIAKIFCVNAGNSTLPFQLEDAARPEPKGERKEGLAGGDGQDKKQEAAGEVRVGQDMRLDNRWIDLRTPANHAIFRIQSRVCQYYRQYFLDRDFVEIHTPKLTPGVSEGGAAVFRLKYLNNVPACLAQSPQLYKQMAVTSDLFRVFEIGPVFRAENSNTHRHMCEFTGMDFEMEIKQHYHEVLKVLGDLFVFIFDNLNEHCKKELEAIRTQFPFEDLKYPRETLVLQFWDAVKMLREAGEPIGDYDDFSTPQEKLLGKLVKAKYDTDFYIVDKYPLAARPFYTMPCPNNPNYTNSYDVFVRGEEITSGAQRIHDTELLKKRAQECGIPLSNLTAYLESFKYGAWPHGGAGIGLERVVMLFLGLDNIRKTSMFPRTPLRLTP